jgi:hypothetical protein
MSRSYDFAVEGSPVVSDDQAEEIKQEIDSELGACNIDYWYEHTNKTIFVDGSTTLCGGESEEEATVRLREAILKKFPGIKEIVTKWLYTEGRDWDNIITWNVEDDKEE